MKEDFALQHSRRLNHVRAFQFDPFSYLAQLAVKKGGGASAIFGRKPSVADYTPTDLTTEYAKAAEGDLANMPEISKLLESILPGWNESVKTGMGNALALEKGQIPEDVQGAVRRSSAFQSLMGGFGGSGMSKALTARDFGLTSLQLQGMGENSAQRWANVTSGAVAPWMVTGPQQASMTMQNNLYKQAVQQMKYNVAAAPDPGAAGTFNIQTALGSMAASFGLGSAMGAMGGGGGRGIGSGVQSGAQGVGANAGTLSGTVGPQPLIFNAGAGAGAGASGGTDWGWWRG